MSIKAYVTKAQDAVTNGLQSIQNGAKKVGSAIVNGAKVSVTNIGQGIEATFDHNKQEAALLTARTKVNNLCQAGLDKINDTLETAANTISQDGYNAVVGKAINIAPLLTALESAKPEVSQDDNKVTAAGKKAIRALLSYHQITAEKGEKAARVVADKTYVVFKYLLSPLSFFKTGRVVQEAISLAFAAIARAVTTVAAAVIFALPELIALGALATAGTFAGVGIAAGGAIAASIIGALKISGYVLAGLTAVGYVARREIQIHQLNKNVERLANALQVAQQEEETQVTRAFYNPARYLSFLQGVNIPLTGTTL